MTGGAGFIGGNFVHYILEKRPEDEVVCLDALLVLAYHRTFRLPVSISRCSNNYGPYHFPEKLIPLSIVNALADKPLPVWDRRERARLAVCGDHCAAIDRIVREGREGEIYNIGGHRRAQRAHESAGREGHFEGARQAGEPDPLRHGPPRPRPALRHRSREDRKGTRLAAGDPL